MLLSINTGMIEAVANKLTLLLHQLLHEMKNVTQTLKESRVLTASQSDSESAALAIQLLPPLQCCQSMV